MSDLVSPCAACGHAHIHHLTGACSTLTGACSTLVPPETRCSCRRFVASRLPEWPDASQLPDAVDAVNHPSHYGGGDNVYEAIKVIAAWGLDFCLGNTVKYIARAGKKDASKLVEDLAKAEWYLSWHIDSLLTSTVKCEFRPPQDPCNSSAWRLVDGQPRCHAHTPKVTRLK